MQQTLEAHIIRWQAKFAQEAQARHSHPSRPAPRVRSAAQRPTSPSPALKEKLSNAWWAEVCNRVMFRDVPAVVSKPSILVHVVPADAVTRDTQLDLRLVANARSLLQGPGEAFQGNDSRVWWAHGPTYRVAAPNLETRWATRFMRPGIVEWELNLGRLLQGDERLLVRLEDLERLLADSADRSLALFDRVGLAPKRPAAA
jgi:hypothetical protein